MHAPSVSAGAFRYPQSPMEAAERGGDRATLRLRSCNSELNHPRRVGESDLTDVPDEPFRKSCVRTYTGGLHYPDRHTRRQALFGLAALCVLMSHFAILDLASVEGRWQLTPAEDDGRLVVIVTHFGIPGG